MGELRVLNAKGDTAVKWEKAQEQTVEDAKKVFDLIKTEYPGAAFFAMDELGLNGSRISEFDPDAKFIVAVPPMAGGSGD